jgi:hypothetical protein
MTAYGIYAQTHDALFLVERFDGDESYQEALKRWDEHDDLRLAGRRPHVRHYEVRDVADPKYVGAIDGMRAAAHGRDVLITRGFASDKQAARRAIKHYIPEPHDRRSGYDRRRRQGDGGWYFEQDGRTLAQGLDGLARVAKRRGWIVQVPSGRWVVIAPPTP